MEHSEQIGELIAGLAVARSKFKPVLRRATNPYFQSNYAELDDYIEATKDGLSESGLAVIQDPVYNPEQEGVVITTLLAHSSGQWVLERLWMPVLKPDAQGVGSAITYGRRYSYSAILNVASKGEDDDGNASTGTSQKDRGQRTTEKVVGKTINEAQRRALWAAIKSSDKSEDEFRKHLAAKYGVEHTTNILQKDLDAIIRWLSGAQVPAPKEDMVPALKASLRNTGREPGSDDDDPPLLSPPLDFKK